MSQILAQKCIMPECNNIVTKKNGRGQLKKFCEECGSKRSCVISKYSDPQVKCEKCGSLFIPHSSSPKSGRWIVRYCSNCKVRGRKN